MIVNEVNPPGESERRFFLELEYSALALLRIQRIV
jgi:hypothetical protein